MKVQKNGGLNIGLAMIFVAGLVGCSGKVPMAPANPISFDLSVPMSQELQAALAGADKNEVLYAVRTAAGIVERGKLKATTSSSADGSLKVSLNVMAQDAVISLQLNDAATHEPLAIGASYLSFGGRRGAAIYPPYKGKPTLTLDMGAVNTNCSTFDHAAIAQSTSLDFTFPYQYPNYSDAYVMGYYNGNTYLGLELVNSQCVTVGACATQAIAYLGNGNLVDFAFVPAIANFYSYSSESKAAALGTTRANALFQAGDVYCVKLNSAPGGHAWVQVASIDSNNRVYLRYRVNSYFPFYGLEETPCYTYSP